LPLALDGRSLDGQFLTAQTFDRADSGVSLLLAVAVLSLTAHYINQFLD